jgi:hypothetical protein
VKPDGFDHRSGRKPRPELSFPFFQTRRSTVAITTDTDRIRELNDKLRQDLTTGYAVITPGIAALGQEAVERLVKTIQVFDDFHHANDPYQEHDFGSFEADGQTIFFKIDYYDETLTMHSPDAADPSVTKRVRNWRRGRRRHHRCGRDPRQGPA